MHVKSNVRRSASTRHAAGSNSRSVNRFGLVSLMGQPGRNRCKKAANASAKAAFFIGQSARALAPRPRCEGGQISLQEPIDFMGVQHDIEISPTIASRSFFGEFE